MPRQNQPKANQTLIYALNGPDLFRHHCAPCHGVDAKGDGPAAKSLRVRPPDLRLIAKRNSGKFPTERVRKMIIDDVPPAHGSREMPVWGPIFHQVEEDRDYGAIRVENLLKYLESIQEK